MVEVRRFELLTLDLQSRCSTAELYPLYVPTAAQGGVDTDPSGSLAAARDGRLEWTRTTDLTLIRRVL